ncbi:uncharacterized mitochondrial protein AtMg00860-like [Physcomitrium patens]|uniref:uncharacterized mitochondrial protein AtMg00860-like n=1 Tax=Physcomitrium patens TaxID=3218 RepID=UPI003CCD2A9E
MAEHLACLDNYLNQCDKYGISLNLEKYQFGVLSGKLLGQIVFVEGITMDPDKVTRILGLPKPDTMSAMRGFIGHVSYYWHFIESFAVICQPLIHLLKKSPSDRSSLIWTQDCTFAFDELKWKMIEEWAWGESNPTRIVLPVDEVVGTVGAEDEVVRCVSHGVALGS